jgi:quinol monooxygenase YgiN
VPYGAAMSAQGIQVVATIPAKEDGIEGMRAALTALAEASREEAGCLAYDLFESATNAGVFITVERWADKAAMDAHMGTDHIATAMTAMADHLGGGVSIHPLRPVSVG